LLVVIAQELNFIFTASLLDEVCLFALKDTVVRSGALKCGVGTSSGVGMTKTWGRKKVLGVTEIFQEKVCKNNQADS